MYYIPCSGLSGENLTEAAKEEALTSWYNDRCLVQLIGNNLLIQLKCQTLEPCGHL